MSAIQWDPKDPDEVVDYTLDWSTRLGATDTLLSSTWPDFPSGLTKDSDTYDDTSTIVWISGGTAGEVYNFTNRVTTYDGRTYDQTVSLKCKEA